jgi:hypothetical protein
MSVWGFGQDIIILSSRTLNATLLPYDLYMQLLFTNISILSFTVIYLLVLYGLEIVTVLLQNKMK